jgi:hypothetical protein
MIQEPFTFAINAPTTNTSSHIYLVFHKTCAETVCSGLQLIKTSLQVRNTALQGFFILHEFVRNHTGGKKKLQ